MSEPVREQVVMREFPGVVLNADPRDLDAGAAREQTNLVCYGGSLIARRGNRDVTFDQTIDATPS